MSVKCRRTGLAYDEKLTKHYSLWNPDFTEVPDRIIKPFQRCEEYNLIERCHTVQSRYATEEEILLLHTENHLKTLKSSIHMTEEELKELSQKFDYIYFHNDSYASACLALGTSLQLVDDIITDKISNGFAIIRPPGHHAGREEFNGYCYFNNAAVCAQNAIQKHNFKRILIVDWDVHHGQGIQKFFYNDPRVLYFSIHRYEYRQEWPNLRESDYDFVGSEDGQGYNINVPLNEEGCTNSDYLFIFFNVLLPIAYQFDPELVIISAGFDCALGCPEGEMEVTPPCFPHFINLLSPLAGGKLALLLEGGYCIQSLSESVAMSVKALLGDVCPPIKATQSPKDSVVESVLNVIKVLRPYWSCLRYQPLLAPGQKPKISTLVRLPSVSSVSSDPCEEGKVYPLIQECYDTSPDVEEKLGENMARLEHIIQSTVLRKTKHKLALVSSEDHESGDTSLVQDVFIKLKDMDMWDKCRHIKQENTSSKEDVKNLIDSILSNECQSGILFIRPPVDLTTDSSINGTSSSMLNSISTAADYTRSKYKLKRVLFVDWTNKSSCKNQELFYDDKSILYISLNCCDSGDNGTTCISKTGDKSGEGYNINIAWRTKDVRNGDYIAAFYQVVLPVAYEFSPEMVFVVAGFDQVNRKGGEYSVSPACFGYMTQLLKGLADGKLLMAIESRENNEKITDSVVSCISVLLDNPCHSLGSLTPSQSGVESICKVADELNPYWSSLQYREAIPELDAETIQSHISEDKKSTETKEDNN